MKVSVIGTGYVGLVSGACLADAGNNVFCCDIDAAKIATLNAGGLPIFEPGLEAVVARNRAAGRLVFPARPVHPSTRPQKPRVVALGLVPPARRESGQLR